MNLFWWRNKHKKKDVVIKESCYNKLPDLHKSQFVKLGTPGLQGPKTVIENHTHYVNTDDSGNFLLSMVAAEATDSVLLGTAIGGAVVGAMVGEMIAGESTKPSFDFGGGDTGGGGASGSWDQASSDQGSDGNNSNSFDFNSGSDSTSSSCFDSSSFDSSSSSSDSNW